MNNPESSSSRVTVYVCITVTCFVPYKCISEHMDRLMTWLMRIQCFPGKIGRFDSISARIHPTDQMSTGRWGDTCSQFTFTGRSKAHWILNSLLS